MCDTNAGGLVGSAGVTSEVKHWSHWQVRVAIGQLEEAIPTGTEPKVLNTQSKVQKNRAQSSGRLIRRNRAQVVGGWGEGGTSQVWQ